MTRPLRYPFQRVWLRLFHFVQRAIDRFAEFLKRSVENILLITEIHAETSGRYLSFFYDHRNSCCMVAMLSE